MGWEVGLYTGSSPNAFPAMSREKNPQLSRAGVGASVKQSLSMQSNIHRLWLFLVIIFSPTHLEMTSPDNWTFTRGLLPAWPTLPSWSLTDQMDSSVRILSTIALTWNEGGQFYSFTNMCGKLSVFQALQYVLRVQRAKTNPAFKEVVVFRPGSPVNNRHLEFSYPFGKCLLSMSSMLGTGDLAGTRKTWSLPLENIPEHSSGEIRW